MKVEFSIEDESGGITPGDLEEALLSDDKERQLIARAIDSGFLSRTMEWVEAEIDRGSPISSILITASTLQAQSMGNVMARIDDVPKKLEEGAIKELVAGYERALRRSIVFVRQSEG